MKFISNGVGQLMKLRRTVNEISSPGSGSTISPSVEELAAAEAAFPIAKD